MDKYSGFLYITEDKEEIKEIGHRINDVGFFMDPLKLGDMHLNEPEISLISLGGNMFTHAALMTPKREAGSIKYMMAFSNCISLASISFEDISQKIGRTAWAKIRSDLPISGRSERLNLMLWETLIESIKELRPAIAEQLMNLIDLRENGYKKKNGPGFDIMALEKDVVGTFLDIAGFDRKKELQVQLSEDAVPFLKNVVGCKTLEEFIINHDLLVIGNAHQQFKSYQGCIIEYPKSSGGKLTVMNVNNTDIEHTIGVDAILYDHRYDSYVMIQFKRMTDRSVNDIGYRFYDDDKDQIEKMKKLEYFHYKNTEEDKGRNSYRLHPGCFYLKLCAPETYTPLSPDLIRGIYLPLDLWPFIEASQKESSQKGIRVSYKSTRYLNNTLFSDLAQEGWIGSKPKHTKLLTNEICKIIQMTIDAKKSAMIGEIR